MKRLFSFMLAVVLVLSLGITASAEDNTGSITITNAVKGNTYKLYKIFDANYAVDEDGKTKVDDNGNPIVAYSIKNTDQFFSYMFGENGKAENPYFSYDTTDGAVTRKENTENSDIIAYLTAMVRSNTHSFQAEETKTAESETLVFSNLPYGYYLIDKGTGTAVTIDSNAPNVEVIDKNQSPGSDFVKLVWDEEDNEWTSGSSANIGDIVDFKVEFEATNYDGEKQIKYYSVADTKGNALWVEFNDVEVWVGGVKLERGYYHATEGEHKTDEWEFFGNWTVEQKADPDNAQWYMVHRGFDAFDIIIPWMNNYNFEGTTNDFSLTFDKDPNKVAKSIYASPVDVIITYNASVEPGASIGNPPTHNLWNEADLNWTTDTTTGPEPSNVTVPVYALGLEKVDADTGKHLSGAVFEVYRNEACTTPVYVIPTDVKGIYILDDLNTNVSGELRDTSRGKYKEYLEAYLGPDYATTQRNVVTSEVNGKLAVLGLEAGHYYLKEIDAPDGYNKLATTTLVTVGEPSTSFFVIADENGNVYDAQTASGNQKKQTYTVTSTIVENSRGVELPSTGGEGTMMMITIGTIIALAFAVLLITHKKMSVYHD